MLSTYFTYFPKLFFIFFKYPICKGWVHLHDWWCSPYFYLGMLIRLVDGSRAGCSTNFSVAGGWCGKWPRFSSDICLFSAVGSCWFSSILNVIKYVAQCSCSIIVYVVSCLEWQVFGPHCSTLWHERNGSYCQDERRQGGSKDGTGQNTHHTARCVSFTHSHPESKQFI